MKQLLVLLCFLLSPSLSLCQGFLRIINGTNAESRQLPYQVALHTYFHNSLDEPHICGGAIISRRWILTAAHCLQEPDGKLLRVTVLAGIVDKRNRKNPYRIRQVVRSGDAKVHPDYDRDTVANDIGLLRLPRSLKLNKYVQIAKLPKREENNTYVGSLATIAGWGMVEDEHPTDLLQYINVTIISNQQCEQEWNDELKGNRKFMLDSFLCIDSKEGLPCRGDSGGPLVLNNDTRTVVGIVSHGYDAQCRIRVPDIFTRVSSFVDWIEKYTGRLT